MFCCFKGNKKGNLVVSPKSQSQTQIKSESQKNQLAQIRPFLFLTLRVDRRPTFFFFGRLGKDCWSGQGRSGVVSKEMACLPQRLWPCCG